MSVIKLECCDGNEKYTGRCLKDRCPNYRRAEEEVRRKWPYQGTGFGNLYGNPTHGHVLAEVRRQLDSQEAVHEEGDSQEDD
jgi:hypothetical protein